MDNLTQQADEVEALLSIYEPNFQVEKDSDRSYSMEVSKDIKLFLNFHDKYPSEEPPRYMLLAPCLSKRKKDQIAKAFDEIYKWVYKFTKS